MGLVDDPFAWRVTKSGDVRITRGRRAAGVLRGASAAGLADALARTTPEECQQLLARATGNYRHGNERRATRD